MSYTFLTPSVRETLHSADLVKLTFDDKSKTIEAMIELKNITGEVITVVRVIEPLEVGPEPWQLTSGQARKLQQLGFEIAKKQGKIPAGNHQE